MINHDTMLSWKKDEMDVDGGFCHAGVDVLIYNDWLLLH